MQYRTLGNLDCKLSALGFGTLRLPLLAEDPTKVDDDESIRMMRYAIDHGVNYVDTAYGYLNGNSERVVGKALRNGYRERIKLTTKLHARHVEKADDFDRIFNHQLEKLQVNKLDFYLLHDTNAKSWAKLRGLGILKWAEKQMANGRFDHFGFSFHDTFDVFKDVINDYDNWTLCQIQYNYMDVECQAGRKGVEFAYSKGLGIVVMEPNHGGKLAQKPPESVARVWESSPKKRTPVDWAMSWVWNQPEISVVLSGMSNMAQVEEDLAIAERSRPGMLTTDDLATIGEAREAFRKLLPVPCTACRYCMPCPNGVDIPGVFAIYNDAVMYDETRWRSHYRDPGRMKQETCADKCLECGVCMEACPQKIEIPEWMKKVDALLGNKH